MSGSKQPCLFCGRTGLKLTREHVFPKWLARAMGLKVNGLHVGTGGEQLDINSLAVTLREVCGECNEGWMHDLEHAFGAVMFPAIFGRRQTLDVGAQRVAATWAVKTTLLVHRTWLPLTGQQTMGPQDGYYHALYEQRQPPGQTRVWFAKLNIDLAVEGSVMTISWATPLMGADGWSVGIFYFLSVGYLLVVVFLPTPQPGDRLLTIVNPGAERAGHFVQLWPNKVEEVGWPPPSVLTGRDLEALWPGGEWPPIP